MLKPPKQYLVSLATALLLLTPAAAQVGPNPGPAAAPGQLPPYPSPVAPGQLGPYPSPAEPGSPTLPRFDLNRLGPTRPSGVRPMTLQEVLDLGLTQNPQMQMAREKVIQARATYEQQKSAKAPKLIMDNSTSIQPERSIDTEPLLERLPVNTNFPDRLVLVSPVTDQFRLSLQMLLTSFGKIENAIAASFLQIDVQISQADVDRLNLAYTIKESFFNKLKADASVESSRQNLSVANQNLDDTQALFEQGVMSMYDILQSEIEVTRSVQGLAANLTRVDQAYSNIGNVLAERAFLVQPVQPPEVRVQPEIEMQALENYALLHRPEIRTLEYSKAVAQKLIDSAYGENQPTVTLAANYQTAFGQSLSPVDVPSLTLQIQWQIFDGGYRKAKVAEAQSVLRSLDASEAQLVNTILNQVQQYWLNLQQTAYNVNTAEQQLANTIQYYDMARRRYINGLATTLEVSEALRDLIDARQDLVEARFDRDLAFARLEQALGRDVPDRNLTVEFLTTEDPAQESTP